MWACLLHSMWDLSSPTRNQTRVPYIAPAACSFPGENARSWEALGEARPGQSSLSAGALPYRAWAPPSAQSPGPAAALLLPSLLAAGKTGKGLSCLLELFKDQAR